MDIIHAFQNHQWPLFGALFVGGFIALGKQGWLGAWIASKIPSQYIPLLSVATGAASLVSSEIIAGKPWQQALVDGVQAGLVAVFGHELVIEGFRGGKEIIPEKTKGSALPPTLPTAILALLLYGCTKQQALAVNTIVTDLTNAICSQTATDPVWVTFVCTGVSVIENGIPAVVQSMTVKVPVGTATKFGDAHKAK